MIRIVYENVNRYVGVIDRDKEKIIEEINNLRNSCDELKSVWKGYDADMFFNNMEDYLNKMRNIPGSMERISHFIGMASMQYKQEDEIYGRDLKRETLRYKVK